MAGKGRPDKYKTHVEPYLKDIEVMALSMTEKEIAETLEIAYSTFKVYKRTYSALNDSLKKGRRNLVIELKNNLIRASKGYHYDEKKVIKERDEFGNMIVVREEVTTKYMKPDVAATNLLLKNYDKDNWANDPQMLELRKKELELQERRLENGEW